MTRHPASDERSVTPVQPKRREKERFFVYEVALFLRAAHGDVRKFLRKRRLLRMLGRGTGRASVAITSARGVALAIAHFRAYQGEQVIHPASWVKPLRKRR